MKDDELRSKLNIKGGNEGRQTQRDFMKPGSGLIIDPIVFVDKRKSVDGPASPGKNGGVTKTKGEILRYSVHVAP